jgi:hypothetical protein
VSVYVLVGGLRRWLSNAPLAPAISRRWLRAGFFLSLAGYLALKTAGAFVHLSPAADLTVLPASLCALVMALNESTAEEADQDTAARRWPPLLACVLLVAFAATYIPLNTVPTNSAQDESAIVNGAREVATNGSLRVTNPLNDRYHTNIIGALDVTYRTPTDMYHRVFPGTALSYAPFAQLPGDSGFYVYTAIFGTAAVVALFLLAGKLLRSWWAAALAALIFAVSPAFGHWATTVYNNVPVLSLELGALALVFWSTPPKRWQLALAGIFMTLAVFVRVTEFVFVPPMIVLVWWRCRSVKRSASFGATALACVPLVLITNAMFFHSPFFFPHVGSSYLPLQQVSGGTGHGQGLVEGYFLYAIGVSGSSSNFHPINKLHYVFFHIRYLASSTFAFPFLSIAYSGLVWRVAARRREAWLLPVMVAAPVLAVLFLYGHQHENYFGYGMPIVRSSFVRYSLIVYALLAIGAGAFFSQAARLIPQSRALASSSLLALVAIVGLVGIAQSYDWQVYGFDRLNSNREHDRAAWQQMDAYLQRQKPVLLIVGLNSMKLVDGERYPDTINYSIIDGGAWDQLLFPVVTSSLEDRRVYMIISTIQPESVDALAAFNKRYFINEEMHNGSWALYTIEQPVYEAPP